MADDGYSLTRLQHEAAEGARDHIVRLLSGLKARHGLSQQRILELGSGLGGNLALFAADNVIQGVEAVAEAAEAATRSGIPTLCADIARGPIPCGEPGWDWILMLDVLEHLVDPHRLLEQARAGLAPGGRIVVNVPNQFDWRGRWGLLRGRGIDASGYFPGSTAWTYPHLRFFRHADLLGLLRSAGFEPIEDASALQSSLPLARHLPRVSRVLTRRWVDLAAAGFFVVCRRAGR